MNRLIEVMNLSTGEYHFYSSTLTSRQALINCYEQYGRANWNTWDYDYTKYDSLIKTGEKTMALGDYCTLKEISHA